MRKRVVTSQKLKKIYRGFEGSNSERGHYEPEIDLRDYEENGYLDTEIGLGSRDMKKLGYPKRIKLVIYSLDD